MLFQTIAQDSKGNRITADEAVRGEDFFCPSCKGAMILRRGEIKIAHFAHKNLTPNCNPETVLHKLGKEKVKHILDNHLDNKEPLTAGFMCNQCYGMHYYDITERIQRVELERSLDMFRPDVSLVDLQDSTRAVIEIVVTHAPEPEVLKLYDRKNIIYLRINLSEYKDLESLEEKMQYINNGNVLNFEKLFSEVVEFKEEEEIEGGGQLFIIDFPCEQCGRTTKVALINAGDPNPFNRIDPEDFEENEVKIAREHGVSLQYHKFSRNGDSYLVNKCSTVIDSLLKHRAAW